jgi:putative hydrolase of the HAD superfamily
MIQSIILDFDNTLYNYDKANQIALENLFLTICNNWQLPMEDIKYQYSKINKDIKNNNNPNNKHNKSIYIKQLLENLNISLTEYDKYLSIYNDCFYNHFKLYDGVINLLELLKNHNIKIGILSNNQYLQQYEKLKQANILGYIDAVQTSDECGEEKPHLTMFWSILHKLNAKPDHTAYIGDNFFHDVEPSLQLKMLTFHFIPTAILKLNKSIIEFGNYHDLSQFFTTYFQNIKDFVFLSKYFGQSDLNVQGPGGNISIKQGQIMFIKTSGTVFANTNEFENYCLVNNSQCLECLENNQKSKSKFFGDRNPSMEMYFHSFMKTYTVHIHFTLSNIFFCSDATTLQGFTEKYKIIDYIPPGMLLAQEIKQHYDVSTDIYFLKNHGLIITSDRLDGILNFYKYIYQYFNQYLNQSFQSEWQSFEIHQLYYMENNISLVVKYNNYPHQLLKNLVYCFPDLAVFIEKMVIVDNLKQLKDKLKCVYDIIILDKKVYLCGTNLQRIYALLEILDSYKTLHQYTNYLQSIQDVNFLQTMEEEIMRKK